MNDENPASFGALVQEKIDADTEFHESIADLEEDEKAEALKTKWSEVAENEYKSIADKAKKDEELANNYKTRAEKAEKAGKSAEPTPKGDDAPKDDLSSKDLYALMQAQVHQDDIDEVTKAAKLLGKSIPEALEDTVVQSILEKRVEFRKTANATNTRTQRGGPKKISDQEVLDKASKGDLPEPGSEEAERLFWAKRGGKPAGK